MRPALLHGARTVGQHLGEMLAVVKGFGTVLISKASRVVIGRERKREFSGKQGLSLSLWWLIARPT